MEGPSDRVCSTGSFDEKSNLEVCRMVISSIQIARRPERTYSALAKAPISPAPRVLSSGGIPDTRIEGTTAIGVMFVVSRKAILKVGRTSYFQAASEL